MYGSLKLALGFCLAFALTACGDTTATTASKAPAATATYKVNALTISVSEDVRVNELPRFKNEPKEQTVETLKSYLTRAMQTNFVPAFTGQTPVNVEAQVTGVQMATDGGVVLMGANSRMSGNVILRDARSGEVIAVQNVTGVSGAMTGSGFGILVAMAVNSNTSPEKRYTEVTDSFSKQALESIN
ncbi:hypothetical protein [Aestuariivita boseongensis]|uniref:hypothetical protein n=1 Tax=Aestuariivita boseongensis TaxID=1470562 RepID=UPI000681A15A|nr:hypothetical protein [Aestuariivita boseongensis]